jgi:hypothetical protein
MGRLLPNRASEYLFRFLIVPSIVFAAAPCESTIWMARTATRAIRRRAGSQRLVVLARIVPREGVSAESRASVRRIGTILRARYSQVPISRASLAKSARLRAVICSTARAVCVWRP